MAEPERCRILAVDSDIDHLVKLTFQLEALGDVEAATSAEEGWALVQATDPDVVIVDQRLPGMPGLELLNRAGDRDPHVGRVLLTNYGDTQVTIDALEHGRVDAFVAKPCLPHQLRLMVTSVLERTRLERDNARLVEDLTARNRELREAMDSLRAAQQRILDSERLAAVGRMIAMIVHDFRGPLSVVHAAGNAFARGSLGPEDALQISTEIRQETARMGRMCNELLEVSRASGGALDQNPEDFDDLVRNALTALVEEAGRTGVRIETSLGSSATLLLDGDRFRRAIRNLGYNAIEAMSDGGVLRVATRAGDEGVALSVVDSGKGVPEDIQSRIFEPFFTSGKHGGSGLGLAVVKKVIEDHGGSIELRKPEGGGAAFVIQLPAYLTKKSD